MTQAEGRRQFQGGRGEIPLGQPRAKWLCHLPLLEKSAVRPFCELKREVFSA